MHHLPLGLASSKEKVPGKDFSSLEISRRAFEDIDILVDKQAEGQVAAEALTKVTVVSDEVSAKHCWKEVFQSHC